jgi:hypothetical protein
MKRCFYIFVIFSLLSTLGWSQNYKNVDSIVLKYPGKFGSTSKIAKRINSDFSNDFDKIRAIYTWVTNNIVYDPKEYGKYNFSYSTKKDFDLKQSEYETKLSTRVISKRKAVCEGYSVLFKVICDHLNIKSKVVSGCSKTLVKDIGKRYSSDHSWNIVRIEKKDYLIDTTWGAGTYNNGFEKQVNYFYFLTKPNLFIKNHYPDNYENSLLTETIEKQDFLDGPLIHNYDFELVNPLSGIIKKSEVNTIKFKFLTKNKVNSVLCYIDKKNSPVTNFKNGDNLEFEIDISKIKTGRTLSLYFDSKLIIEYKLE